MRVLIETIPHYQQDYNTVGNWKFDAESGTLHIEVSQLTSVFKEFLVGIHEYIEAMLCLNEGTPQQEVTDFDLWWEQNKIGDEPGDAPTAPYKREHCIATGIERMLAAILHIDWYHYEEELNVTMGGKLGEQTSDRPTEG